ncbi:MAG: glycosyltransferase, partial [Desulfobacterales bacterium]|nr:glycosyltransferase [Desulfobacterales bacterium]
FADAIERLLKNKDLRRQMGRAAQSHVRQRHDLNRNYQKMERMLQAVVKK